MSQARTPAAARKAGAAVAAALLAGSAALAPAAPSPAPAVAAEAGQIRVDLKASVGEDWFAQIGDRAVTLELISGVNPRADELEALDVPALKRDEPGRFVPVKTVTSEAGVATFTGLASGVYLVSVADAQAPADKRVSYAPFVVPITQGQFAREVAPKAQQVGVSVDPLTACTTPEWKDAAAPSTYVEYDFTSTVPNLSTDGTLGTYEIALEFSKGHTVQWAEGNTRSVIARGAGAASPRALTFDAAAARVTLQAQPAAAPSTTPRKDAPVEKLEAPRLSIRGAGQTVRLEKGPDYTETQNGNNSATFALTDQGRAKLAELKAADPATTVKTWVPAKANDTAPWGTPARDNVLGELDATASLLADGMDETRTPVRTEHTSHINVVDHDKCFGPAAATTTVTPTPGPGVTATVTETASEPADVTEVITHETTGAGGAPITVTETVVRGAGPGSGGAGGSGSNTGGQSVRERAAALASTGAGVIGITLVAALLIALGLWLRRRDDGDEEA